MFSPIPTTGTPTRSNILAPRNPSPTATSFGVGTTTAPARSPRSARDAPNLRAALDTLLAQVADRSRVRRAGMRD